MLKTAEALQLKLALYFKPIFFFKILIWIKSFEEQHLFIFYNIINIFTILIHLNVSPCWKKYSFLNNNNKVLL